MTDSERHVLTLRWRCLECGWVNDCDAPGFAGDGLFHYPDGSTPCGPIMAQKQGFRTTTTENQSSPDSAPEPEPGREVALLRARLHAQEKEIELLRQERDEASARAANWAADHADLIEVYRAKRWMNYTQADLDFFADNADEYFDKWIAERRRADESGREVALLRARLAETLDFYAAVNAERERPSQMVTDVIKSVRDALAPAGDGDRGEAAARWAVAGSAARATPGPWWQAGGNLDPAIMARVPTGVREVARCEWAYDARFIVELANWCFARLGVGAPLGGGPGA